MKDLVEPSQFLELVAFEIFCNNNHNTLCYQYAPKNEKVMFQFAKSVVFFQNWWYKFSIVPMTTLNLRYTHWCILVEKKFLNCFICKDFQLRSSKIVVCFIKANLFSYQTRLTRSCINFVSTLSIPTKE